MLERDRVQPRPFCALAASFEIIAVNKIVFSWRPVSKQLQVVYMSKRANSHVLFHKPWFSSAAGSAGWVRTYLHSLWSCSNLERAACCWRSRFHRNLHHRSAAVPQTIASHSKPDIEKIDKQMWIHSQHLRAQPSENRQNSELFRRRS